VVSVTPRPLFTPGKDPVPIVQEVGWAPGSVWTGTENLAVTGIRSPDPPARSQSLYLLRYPAHDHMMGNYIIKTLSIVSCLIVNTPHTDVLLVTISSILTLLTQLIINEITCELP
jgi:hypothetical protein